MTLPGECGAKWPLEDPNAEDLALARTHECWLPVGHDRAVESAQHQCRCGAWMTGT